MLLKFKMHEKCLKKITRNMTITISKLNISNVQPLTSMLENSGVFGPAGYLPSMHKAIGSIPDYKH